MSTKHYVAEVEKDGTTFCHFYDVEDGNTHFLRDTIDAAHNNAGFSVMNKAKITTSRRDPQKIAVKISQITLVEGQAKRSLIKTISLTPPLVRMTKEEYEYEIMECTRHLPDDFRGFVVSQAWERGHSAGYEEVVGIATDLADELYPVIRKYAQALKGIV